MHTSVMDIGPLRDHSWIDLQWSSKRLPWDTRWTAHWSSQVFSDPTVLPTCNGRRSSDRLPPSPSGSHARRCHSTVLLSPGYCPLASRHSCSRWWHVTDTWWHIQTHIQVIQHTKFSNHCNKAQKGFVLNSNDKPFQRTLFTFCSIGSYATTLKPPHYNYFELTGINKHYRCEEWKCDWRLWLSWLDVDSDIGRRFVLREHIDPHLQLALRVHHSVFS